MAGDLHCHTKLSVGSVGLEDIIRLAKRQRLATIAITDRDCQGGIVRARVIGERYDLQVIPGVELTCTSPSNGQEVHLLAYLSSAPNRLEGLCHQNLSVRREANRQVLRNITRRYPLLLEFIQNCAQGATCVYPEHLMRALLESGHIATMDSELYHRLFLEPGPDCLMVPMTFQSPRTVLEAIHSAGGIAVLAHPGRGAAVDHLEELVAAGLDGVEVYHQANPPELRRQLLDYARERELLVTGGSGFKGMYSCGAVPLGSEQVNTAQVTALLAYKKRRAHVITPRNAREVQDEVRQELQRIRGMSTGVALGSEPSESPMFLEEESLEVASTNS